MSSKEICEDMVHILAEDSSSYAFVKKADVEFKRSKNYAEDDSQSGRLKTSTIVGFGYVEIKIFQHIQTN